VSTPAARSQSVTTVQFHLHRDLPVLVDNLNVETALVPSVRGILGEDFLRKFDLLIDYGERTLSFNEPAPEGERLPFENSSAYKDQHTFNRLMIRVSFPGAGGSEAVLQLDTAAWVAELFPASHVSLPPAGFQANRDEFPRSPTHLRNRSGQTRKLVRRLSAA